MNALRNKLIGLFALTSVIGLISCQEFLTEDPRNFIDPAGFYATEVDAEAGIVGIYDQVARRDLVVAYHVPNHNNSDETYPWSFSTYDIGFDFTPDINMCGFAWNEAYDGINRANSFIGALEGKEVSWPEANRDKLVAEAKFLRSYFYYILVNYFGDVPLVKKIADSESEWYPARSPRAEVIAFMKSDLEEAIAGLPKKSELDGENISRANQDAARMMMAKLLMMEENWSDAKTYIDEIIASGEYDLEIQYADNWRTSNEHGIESIFEVEFEFGLTPTEGHQLMQYSGPASYRHPVNNAVMRGAFTGIAFTHFFYNSFESIDVRKTMFLDTARHDGPWGRFFIGKYFDPVSMTATFGSAPTNWVMFRYADVLLMSAEVENEIASGPNGTAYLNINEVRKRAGLADLIPGLTHDQFLDSVFVERQKELCFEGHRFFDLKRRGFDYMKKWVVPARQQLIGWLGLTIDYSPYVTEDDMFLPIPRAETDANPNLK